MKQRAGFTLIELLVAISVLLILAAITTFAFGNWRSRTATTEAKNDLQSAAAKLRDYRTWQNGYPATQSVFDTVYQPSGQLTMTYTLRGDGQSYCLKATSTAVPSVIYYIDSRNDTTPTATACT